jgi:hypothetical protein
VFLPNAENMHQQKLRMDLVPSGFEHAESEPASFITLGSSASCRACFHFGARVLSAGVGLVFILQGWESGGWSAASPVFLFYGNFRQWDRMGHKGLNVFYIL